MPEPTQLRALRGNPGKRPLKNDGALPVEAPTRPRFVTGEARAEWNRCIKEMKRQGRLAKTDRAALVAHCTAWARFIDVEGQLNSYLGIGSQGQTVKAALFDVWEKLNKRVIETSAALGLHVNTRVRLPAAVNEEPEVDPLEELRTRGSRRPTG